MERWRRVILGIWICGAAVAGSGCASTNPRLGLAARGWERWGADPASASGASASAATTVLKRPITYILPAVDDAATGRPGPPTLADFLEGRRPDWSGLLARGPQAPSPPESKMNPYRSESASRTRGLGSPKRDDFAQVALDLQDENGESTLSGPDSSEESSAGLRETDSSRSLATGTAPATNLRGSVRRTALRAPEVSDTALEIVEPNLRSERRGLLLDYYQRGGWTHEPGRDAVAFPFPGDGRE